MGKYAKPQKSKKHKKIKFVDPFYNGERKERMHAGRNLDPTNLEQGVSRSMKDFIHRTNQAKEMSKKSRREKKEILKKRMLAQISTEGAEREEPEIPVFKQKKNERHEAFMRRVDSTTLNAIKESQIEASFKKSKANDDPVLKYKEKTQTSETSSKKKEKLQLKKQLKKEKESIRKDKKDAFSKFKDKVEFGDVVHGPPSLTVRPKYAQAREKPAVQSLMLYNVLKSNSVDSASTSGPTGPKGKGSRKLLSPTQKVFMDQERQRAIDMYRQMRKKSQPKS